MNDVDGYTYTAIDPAVVRVTCSGHTDRGKAEGRDRTHEAHRVPQLIAILSRETGTGRWGLAADGTQSMYTGPRATRDTRSGVLMVCPKHSGQQGTTTLRWKALGAVLDALVAESSERTRIEIDIRELRRMYSTINF